MLIAVSKGDDQADRRLKPLCVSVDRAPSSDAWRRRSLGRQGHSPAPACGLGWFSWYAYATPLVYTDEIVAWPRTGSPGNLSRHGSEPQSAGTRARRGAHPAEATPPNLDPGRGACACRRAHLVRRMESGRALRSPPEVSAAMGPNQRHPPGPPMTLSARMQQGDRQCCGNIASCHYPRRRR